MNMDQEIGEILALVDEFVATLQKTVPFYPL
jgi:hypothetical protein